MMKHSLKDFDPVEVARLDAAMWEAYYSHDFLRLLILLFKLFRSQFGTSGYSTFKIAYFSMRAAVTFRKSGNQAKALKYLTKFFREVRKTSVETFNPQKAAELELEWWLIHRYPTQYSIDLADSLASAMAELYQVDPDKLSNYGKSRALAMKERDSHKDPDWQKIRMYLNAAYSSLKSSVTI